MEKKKTSLVVRLIQWLLWALAGFLLIGLFMPCCFSTRIGSSETGNTQNTAFNLKNAISAYYTEYRKYPVPGEPEGDTSLQSDHALMDVLLGSDPEAEDDGLNPRRIAFFTGKQAKPMGKGKFRKGVHLEEGGRGELWDPWGNYYRVVLDTDHDNRVEKPEWDKTSDSAELPESILVWSAGPDGDFDTWQDNVKTW